MSGRSRIWPGVLLAGGLAAGGFGPPRQDSPGRLLEPPASIKALLGGAWSVAAEPPAIACYPLPLEPRVFPPEPEGEPRRRWTAWSQGVIDELRGRIYAAVGDHGGAGAQLYIAALDPKTGSVYLSREINAAFGGRPGRFADGKIQGRLGFGPWPWLWLATSWAKSPRPSPADFESGYRGGHVARYNVETGEIVDEGVPLPRASWPSHRLDAKRGLLYAAGASGELLIWEIDARKPRFAGILPGGLKWSNRVIMLDEDVGFVYSSADDEKAPGTRLIRYDPARNKFEALPAPMPPDESGARGPIRCATDGRGRDGLFWGVTRNGVLFSFDPRTGKIESPGACWPGTKRSTAAIVRSPRGRYLYYLPGADGDAFAEGAPLVQYDTRSKRFKVLAFLDPYLREASRFLAGGTPSVSLDADGARLYVLMNGIVRGADDASVLPPEAFGAPAFLVLDIPEKERKE